MAGPAKARVAQLLRNGFGPTQEELVEVRMRADAMLEKGDLEGQAVWKRIVRAVGEIQRTKQAPSETTQ